MMRQIRSGAALLAVVLMASGPAPAAEVGADVALPPGVHPFDGAITLHYGAIERFSHVWRSDMDTPRGLVLLEGWVMQGSVRRRGETLEWSYRLSNIGRDGTPREMGALEVVTDAAGMVRSARVLEDRWRQGRTTDRAAADHFFDPQDLRFPLCCCPAGPLRMGDVIDTPRGIETLPAMPRRGEALPPGFTEFSVRTVVAGLLTHEGREHLVLQHLGGSATEAEGRRVTGRTSGFTLLDTRSCLPTASIRANRIATDQPELPAMAIVHRAGTQF